MQFYIKNIMKVVQTTNQNNFNLTLYVTNTTNTTSNNCIPARLGEIPWRVRGILSGEARRRPEKEREKRNIKSNSNTLTK
jgi:hypothetical protein